MWPDKYMLELWGHQAASKLREQRVNHKNTKSSVRKDANRIPSAFVIVRRSVQGRRYFP